MTDKKVLITGGSGFIGTNLVEHLHTQGIELLNVDKNPPKNPKHSIYHLNINILDHKGMLEAFSKFGPTHVIHLAARTDLHGETLDQYQDNTEGTKVMAELAATMPTVERAIFASSRLVNQIGYTPVSTSDYNPSTAYGKSKAIGEEIVRDILGDSSTSWTIFRPTSIWGPWFGVPYRNFFDSIKRGRYVHPRGMRIKKSFGYVENSVQQLESLAYGPAATIEASTIYLADPNPIEVYDFASRISKAMHNQPIREVSHKTLSRIAWIGDLIASKTRIDFPLTTFRLDNLTTEMLYDTSPLAKTCGEEVDLDTAIERTISWMAGT